jgi:hypothetical protein
MHDVHEWTPQDWVMFFTAVGTLVTAVLSAINVFINNLIKIRGEINTKKLDENTKITKDGTDAAAVNAKVAANTAAQAKIATEDLAGKLNGSMDSRISTIVKEHLEPISVKLDDHVVQDDKNMKEIMNALKALHKK